MSCYHPLTVWKYPGDKSPIVFTPQPSPYEQLRIPCGKCSGCRADQSLMWSIRAYHESTLHDRNCFVTLTYDDAHLPADGLIIKKHLQDFFKRLRRSLAPDKVRYIACGEYGDKTHRPHYHAILFGQDFRFDKVSINSDLYTSPYLVERWGMGNVVIAPVTMSSICYVCGYVFKKIGDPDTFSLASRRPPIGHNWLAKFHDDISRTGTVSIDGKEYPVPKRYLEWGMDEFEHLKVARKEFALKNAHKATDKALDNLEANRLAKLKGKKEKL